MNVNNFKLKAVGVVKYEAEETENRESEKLIERQFRNVKKCVKTQVESHKQ